MEENTVNTPQKKKLPIPWIAAAAVLLLVAIGLFIWQMQTKKELNQLIQEKEMQRVELQTELDSLLVQHEMVKTEYGELSDSLAIKDSVIQANAVEIKKLLNTQWEYYKVKKKLSALQEIAQGYVHQMDSLYRVNDALTQENLAFREDLDILQKEKELIEKDKEKLTEKVEIASVLKAYNIDAGGIRMRSGGTKEVPTDKTKRLERVKVCFTIGENEVVAPGERTVYMRIARPNKEILTRTRGDDYSFEYNGEMLQYSIVKTIQYDNMPVDVCGYWYKNYSSQEMDAGLYHVDIFCDGSLIGHTTFTLR